MPEKTMADSLRDMAAFLEAQPSLNIGGGITLNLFVHTKEELAAIARNIAPCTKHAQGTWFWVTKDFGNGIDLQVNVEREQVCRKVLKGTRVVPARPAEPEHIEELYDWECADSLLAPDDGLAAPAGAGDEALNAAVNP